MKPLPKLPTILPDQKSDKLAWRYDASIGTMGPSNIGSFNEFNTEELIRKRLREIKDAGINIVLLSGSKEKGILGTYTTWQENMNRRYCKPQAEIAILFSRQSRDWPRTYSYFIAPFGLSQYLTSRHIQHTFILEDALGKITPKLSTADNNSDTTKPRPKSRGYFLGCAFLYRSGSFP